MFDERTYRLPWALLIVGAVFIFGGLSMQATILKDIFTGKPILVKTYLNGRQTSSGYASPGGRFAIALFPVIFWGLGLGMAAIWLNCEVRTTNEGISVRTYKREEFRWRWSDITRAERKMGNEGPEFFLGDDQTSTWIGQVQGSYSLDEEIERRLKPILKDQPHDHKWRRDHR